MLVAERGDLWLASSPRSVWVHGDETGASVAAAAHAFAAGDGLIAYADTALTFRNVGPEPGSVLVFTVVPGT